MKDTPVRLAKHNDTTSLGVEAWLQRHAPYIVFILIIILMILVICLVAVLAQHGNMNITTSEGNNYYYHLKGVI